MSKKKKLLYWAGIINFVIGAFLIYCVIALAYNIGGVKDVVNEYVTQSYPQEALESILSLVKTYFIVNIVADISFGVVYIIYGNYSLEKFKKSKTSLLILTLINIIIGMSLISLVLVLIAVFNDSNDYYVQPEPVTENTNKVDSFYNLAEEVGKLKQQLKNNEITEEQYKEELNKILEKQAKEQ